MVGWNRRNEEVEKEHEEWKVWYRSLSPERKAKVRARLLKNKALHKQLLFLLVGYFVFWGFLAWMFRQH
jgi:hypothetical protein